MEALDVHRLQFAFTRFYARLQGAAKFLELRFGIQEFIGLFAEGLAHLEERLAA